MIVEQLYRDSLQKLYEKQILEYEKIFNNYYTIKECDSNFDNQNRLIQAIVDVAGEKLKEICYLANFISDLILGTDISSYSSTFYNLIYPYLKWKVTERNSRNHRNLCLVLLSIIQQYRHSKFVTIDPIRQEVFDYLVDTLKSENTDQWTQQFAIICLENLEIDEKKRKLF